jgi:photosystem II stability/assembly factor-like uncharacterized protein
MLVGSDQAFADVARSTRTPARSRPSPASEAIFLGQCPACNPQHVTVLRTRDGGASWDRRVVNGFFPTGLAFADPDHGWMTTLVEASRRRSAILATTDGPLGIPCIRRRYRTVTAATRPIRRARSIGQVSLRSRDGRGPEEVRR